MSSVLNTFTTYGPLANMIDAVPLANPTILTQHTFDEIRTELQRSEKLEKDRVYAIVDSGQYLRFFLA